MIRRLRFRHRNLAVAAALLAPAVFVAALMDRKPVLLDSTPLKASERATARPLDALGSRALPVGDARLVATLHESADAARATYLTLTREPDAVGTTGPDVLLYWQLDSGSELADNATLLGPLPLSPAERIDLPTDVPKGRVVFYSLARQSVLATLNVEDML